MFFVLSYLYNNYNHLVKTELNFFNVFFIIGPFFLLGGFFKTSWIFFGIAIFLAFVIYIKIKKS